MPKSEVHIYKCPHCQQESVHADQERHREMNLLLSRLDEQQRRWYGAVESKRMGTGGDRLLSQITGLEHDHQSADSASHQSEDNPPYPKPRVPCEMVPSMPALRS